MKETDEMLSRKEAAKFLKRSPGTLSVWDCTKRYDLKPFKLGTKLVYYWRSELEKFRRLNPSI